MADPKSESEDTKEATPSDKFSMEVEIEGLPYIFRGTIPEVPGRVAFSVHIPNWQEELKLLEENAAPHKIPRSGALDSFRREEGQIAWLLVAPARDADLGIERVRSETYIMKGSRYEDARGLGRFLLNNLLTLADVRSWSITASAYTDGRLSNQDVYAWLERKGFEGAGMDVVRKPRQPDLSQPIAKLLQ